MTDVIIDDGCCAVCKHWNPETGYCPIAGREIHGDMCCEQYAEMEAIG